MGNSDADTPAKAAKGPVAQEQQPSSTSSPAAVYPDWSGFQAYSPIPPHGFFPSVASSSQTHPYMWGAQHMIPPYGTPPPYVMYPHGGLYGHPSLPPGSHPFGAYAVPSPNGNIETSGVATVGNGSAEADGKESEAKEKNPIKRSKESLGSLNMITGKNNNELGKPGFRANGVPSQSGESGSEDSSEGSDVNSQNDSLPKEGGQDSFEAEQTQNGTAARVQSHTLMNEPLASMPTQASAPGGVAGPTTSLNIGMEYWSAPNPSPLVAIHGKVSGTSGVGLVSSGVGGPRENIPSDLCVQDERELKRQRRKQSNRESARRSRLRKQAECEELAQRVEVLKEENNALKAELSKVKKEYQQLVSDNTSLKERYEGASRGTDDSMLGRSNQRSVDNHEKQIDTDTTEGQVDTLKSGS